MLTSSPFFLPYRICLTPIFVTWDTHFARRRTTPDLTIQQPRTLGFCTMRVKNCQELREVGPLWWRCQDTRILSPKGRSVLVVDNSNIRGQSVDNAEIIRTIGEGLREVECTEREIPSTRRYLPPPTSVAEGSLQKRIRFELVLTLVKVA